MHTLKATLREVFSRPATHILFAFVAAALILGPMAVAMLLGPNGTSTADPAMLLIPASLMLPVAFAAGAFPAGSAHSRGTIGYAYLASNHRGWELACRIGIAALACTLTAFAASAIGLGGAHVFVDSVALGGADSADMVRNQAELWIAYPLLAALTAVLLGSGTASFFVWVVESLIVETALSAINQPWAAALEKILPGGAAGNGTAGVVTLAVWVAALAAAAYASVQRRAVK